MTMQRRYHDEKDNVSTTELETIPTAGTKFTENPICSAHGHGTNSSDITYITHLVLQHIADCFYLLRLILLSYEWDDLS